MDSKQPLKEKESRIRIFDNNNHNSIAISRKLLITSIFCACLVAFIVGRIARIRLIESTQRDLLNNVYTEQLQITTALNADAEDYEEEESRSHPLMMTLPDPVMRQGKTIPRSTYTSKNFDTTRTATTHSRWIVTESGKEQCVNLSTHPECTRTLPIDNPVQEEEEQEHLPIGQHLLIDMEDIDSSFLNSEERLASAMLELVNECDLTLLSYQ
jgi:hypothetical protein